MPCYVCLSLLLLYSFLFLFLLSIHFTIVVFLAQTPTTLWEENDHLVHLAESVAHVPLLKRCFLAFSG